MLENLIFMFKAAIMGIVEGVTEFLPISSTGHMVLVGRYIDFTGHFAIIFEIVIQLGAILAVIYLFRRKIMDSFKHLQPGQSGFNLWTSLLIAFIPSAVVGLLFHETIEKYLLAPIPVAGALLVGGLWMIYAEKKYKQKDTIRDIEIIGYKRAFTIGCFQCLSILWPGFSRSAATIIGGWIVGLSSVAAAEFSFFLAIPTMIIATVFTLIKTAHTLTKPEIAALAVGFIVAFLVALVVVDKFIKFLKTKPMTIFAVYRILVGIVILVFAAFKML